MDVDDRGRRRAVSRAIEAEEVDEGTAVGPTAILEQEAAQVLLDDLWRAGLRPSDEVSTTGQLRATQYHLEDMRRLVFRREDDRG